MPSRLFLLQDARQRPLNYLSEYRRGKTKKLNNRLMNLLRLLKIEVRHTFGKKKVSRASCPRFEGGTPSTRICFIDFFLSKKDAYLFTR
jgi:hypothetical protein